MNKQLSIATLGFTLGIGLLGCGSGTDPIVQNQQAITSAKTLRQYFDQSKGDFSALSAADQTAAEKAAGGNAADVQKMFEFMKTSNKTGPANNGR
jgi:hypothetical protein